MADIPKSLVRSRFSDGVEGGLVAVKNFYEKTGRPEAFRWERQYSDQLYDSAGGKLRAELLEEKICEVCRDDDSVFLFKKDGFCHLRCRRCESIYVSPALKQEVVLELFYGEGADPWLDVLMSEEQKRFDRVKFRKGVELLAEVRPPPGRLLDVGCSYGLFMGIALESGWECVGLEPQRRSREVAQQAGFRTFGGTLEQNRLPKASFDAVTLWEVLDHVAHPRALLAEVTRVLAPEGVLLLAVRNSNALAARVLRDKCVIFLGRAHYYLFSVSGLRAFLEEFGFRVHFHETYIAELGVIQNYLQYRDPYGSDQPPPLLDLSPEWVFKNDLGYKIVMVARKME